MIIDETTSRTAVAARRVIGVVVAVFVLGAGLAGFAFWNAFSGDKGVSDASSRSDTASDGSPVTLVVSGDTSGWIVPCGCTSNQSGGLLRRGTYVAKSRRNGPVVVADAGGAPGGTSKYQRRFGAILDGEMAMGLAAHNIGEPELFLGLDSLRSLAREKKLPFISANLRDTQHRLVFDACRIVESGGLRVALIGVLQAYSAMGGEWNWELADPRDAIVKTLNSIQGKFDRVIVLAHVNESDLRELAAALPEVDAVIGGPTGQSLAPVRVGPTLVASATNKGKFLVSLSLPVNGKGTEMTGEVIEMSAEFADDEVQVENVRRFRRELARRDFDAAETGFAPEIPVKAPADYRIAGTETCRTCHAGAFGTWHASGHASTWETLIAEETHVDPFCQQCHTTGYGLPGGFQSRGKSADRVAVGCESCHGPSQAHVEKPEIRPAFAAREQCTRCHDHENSPEFELDAYWKRIVHGRDAVNE